MHARLRQQVSPTASKMKARPNVGAAFACAGIAVFVFFLYLRTLAPTILPYGSPDLLDVPMLQMQACVLGMTHEPIGVARSLARELLDVRPR